MLESFDGSQLYIFRFCFKTILWSNQKKKSVKCQIWFFFNQFVVNFTHHQLLVKWRCSSRNQLRKVLIVRNCRLIIISMI